MINVPAALEPYVDFDDGKMIASDMPRELVPEFEKLQKLYEKTKDDELTDY